MPLLAPLAVAVREPARVRPGFVVGDDFASGELTAGCGAVVYSQQCDSVRHLQRSVHLRSGPVASLNSAEIDVNSLSAVNFRARRGALLEHLSLAACFHLQTELLARPRDVANTAAAQVRH